MGVEWTCIEPEYYTFPVGCPPVFDESKEEMGCNFI